MMPHRPRRAGRLRIDEQVAGMHVGVEEAVAERLAQEALDDDARERREVVAGGVAAPRSCPTS
jgi:hypothetical protein